jgi:hypothetical protein
MWLIVPLIIVVLVIVAVVVTTAMLFALVIHAVPWLLIGLGIWLLVRALRGSDHRHQYRGRPGGRGRYRPGREYATPPRSREAPPAQSEPRSEASPRHELPIDVQVKVEQIRRKADVLLGYADRFPPFSQDLYIVRQTAAEYLPQTINAYLGVPGAGEPLLGEVGKTALDELKGQLDLLDSRLDDIAQDLQRQDLDRLIANRRFLEERFGLRDRPARIDSTEKEADAAQSRDAVGSTRRQGAGIDALE